MRFRRIRALLLAVAFAQPACDGAGGVVASLLALIGSQSEATVVTMEGTVPGALARCQHWFIIKVGGWPTLAHYQDCYLLPDALTECSNVKVALVGSYVAPFVFEASRISARTGMTKGYCPSPSK